MAEFTDELGKTWTLRITMRDVQRVKHQEGIDLSMLLNNQMEGLEKLCDDLPKLVDVVYCLCGSQHDITPEQFAEGLMGDSVSDMARAFTDAYADFCPSRQRTMLKNLAAKSWNQQTMALDKMNQLISGDSVFSSRG